MNKTILINILSFLTIIFAFLEASSQNKGKIALYANGSEFNLSIIEKQLYSLTDIKGKKLFKNKGIFNINDMLATVRNTAAVDNAKKRLLFAESVRYGEESDTIFQKLLDSISVSDQFLQISIIEFNEFIEYKFILYPIVTEKNNKYSQVIDFYNKEFSTRVFRKNEGFSLLERETMNALKELFGDAHRLPKAKISVVENKLYKRFRKSVDTVITVINDTLYLDAFYTIDEDTPNGFLEYTWNRLREPESLPDEKLKIIEKGITCLISPNEAGVYAVELKVFDGVENTKHDIIGKSARDTIYIIVYPKPETNIKPSRIHSFYVQELVHKKNFIENEWDKVVIESTISLPMVKTDSNKIIYNIIPPSQEDLGNYDLNNKSLIGKITHKNIKMNRGFNIKTTFPDGTYSYLDLSINHKVYYPYFFNLGWTRGELQIDTTLEILSNVELWNEANIGLNFKITHKFDIGVVGIFKKRNFEDNRGNNYSLTSLGEVRATYDVLYRKNARLGLTALGKLFQVENKNNVSNSVIGGLRAQLGIKMFQGLSEFYLNMALVSKPISGSFIMDYTEWWGIGFKLYFPEK